MNRVTTIDGVTLFNSAHPLVGPQGGTYSNILSPAADVSVTAFQDMCILFENQVDERGLKVQISPTDVWFAPELQFIAARVLKTTLEPGTGNNDINPVQGKFTPHILHYLTSKTHWYVNASGENKLKFKWRKKPITDATDDYETKGSKHSIRFRCSAGATDWRGWAASLA